MKIDIIEEDGDNTLMFENGPADFTIDVYPESKTYRSRMSMREDVYYRTTEYEYRIGTNPLKVEARLTERMDEPPQQYSVKDGVVLEADIKKEHKFRPEAFIADLKKEVEWNEEWSGSAVTMYLLSKHPDIVSQDDYRRHLRQLSERVKLGIQKIEEALEADGKGLQITDEYEFSGRTIWIPRSRQESMSEDEINKLVEHKNKLQERLFDEKSKDYVGISENEFYSAEDILENVETFLNKKPATEKKEVVEKTGFGVKLAAFVFQWVWLLILVSIALWLLSLVITIIQYSFMFALVASGVLTVVLTIMRKSR